MDNENYYTQQGHPLATQEKKTPSKINKNWENSRLPEQSYKRCLREFYTQK
jgi:hypothetical protein